MKSNSLELIRFLLKNVRAVKRAPLMMGLIILMGIISGASNAALLALIGRWLSSAAPMSTQFIIIFFALCITLPVARFASEGMLIYLSSRAMLELRIRLSRQILRLLCGVWKSWVLLACWRRSPRTARRLVAR